jgi:EthD domain
MVKYLAVLRKKPDWTDEEFRQHWKQVHGPLL